MKNCKAALLALLSLAACTPGAGIKCTLEQAPDSQVIIKQLDLNVYNTLDTVRTNASGTFTYDVKVQEGKPEFVYLFYKDTKIASLLLEKGEKAVVTADTLGNYTVSGSEGSAKLRQVEKAYAEFMHTLQVENNMVALRKAFVQKYRDNVRFVMANSKSLAVIPVLYEQLDENTPVMCQYTDAIHFRNVCDSLKTVYPESKYVKALEKETARRESILKIQSMVSNAPTSSYPELNLPGMDGERHSLSSLGAKVTMVYFWNPQDATHKIFNLDVLIPLYEQYRERGFEIYAVAVDPDKSEWAGIVNAQKLPWVNVNDGLGTSSSALTLFGVTNVPSAYLIADGQLTQIEGNNSAAIRKAVARAF